MISYPNQKYIKVNKEICNSDNLYATINIDSLYLAMGDLNGSAFKMWCYMAKNRDDFGFYLSQEDVVGNWGVCSKSTYHRAIKELIEKGYLQEKTNNHYIFHEKP